MSDIKHLLELLKSGNPNKRYEACEELRVSPQPIPPEALDALKVAAEDPDPDVADAAQRALLIHAPPPKTVPEKKQSNIEETTEEKPVRKTGDLSDVSFRLGILAIVTSFPFLLLLWVILDGLIWWFFRWWYYGWGVLWTELVSLVLGLAALITGIICLVKKRGEKRKAVAGIIMGILAILFMIGAGFLVFNHWGI
jgi:hypothetical protein